MWCFCIERFDSIDRVVGVGEGGRGIAGYAFSSRSGDVDVREVDSASLKSSCIDIYRHQLHTPYNPSIQLTSSAGLPLDLLLVPT
jgi:hypothetical protein